MYFRIKLAEEVFEIHTLYNKVFSWCKDYLISSDEQKPIVITISQEDITREDMITQYMGWKQNPESIMIYHPVHLEVLAVHRKISELMPLYNTFLMHGTVVAYKGYCYVFTAPSGTGKTTRANLWIKEYPDSFFVNGDKPFLKVTDQQVIAYGTPWCGKENYNTNVGLPVRAIFILERSKDGENHIRELSFQEAFSSLYSQIYHPENKDAMKKTLQLLKKLDKRIHIYEFKSQPSAEAIRLAYETAKPK